MTDALVERFRSVITAQLGLAFDDAKTDYLGEVLRRRGGDHLHAYLDRLAAGNSEELGALAEELTVGETYFFRHREQMLALAEVALPERMRARASARTLRILSAGCASGEEPYSLAIIARGIVPEGWTVTVRGVDVNPAALERARAGRYSAWAMRETPAEVQRAWFRTSGREVILDSSIRAMVQLEQRNLAAGDPELWQPRAYDIVFCRNVLMYFAPDVAQRVVARIERSLAPGGYLFLGHAETLRGLSQRFHLCHTHGTFYYQQREHGGEVAPPEPQARVAVQAVELGATWIDAIQSAADRIRALSEQAAAPAPAAQPARRPSVDRTALQLLASERYDEALALLDGARATDPDALLLHAVLLVHRSRLAEAEACCRALLAQDELDAGAHYVLALCREVSGDLAGAVEHNGIAAYLDPMFAMPRLQLGLIARRRGDRDTARRELGHALVLLQREDASRVLLFGGGFRRDALVALCRAELARVEATP
jgi:chemotaxis protein methyltransferase CheR